MNLMDTLLSLIIVSIIAMPLALVSEQSIMTNRQALEAARKTRVAEKVVNEIKKSSNYTDDSRLVDGYTVTTTKTGDDIVKITVIDNKTKTSLDYYSYLLGDRNEWVEN